MIDARTLRRLAAADARLDAAGVKRFTLSADRPWARSLEALGHALAPRLAPLPAGATETWSEGLVATAEAIRAHFPDNLLWDLEYLSASVLREAAREPGRAVETLRAVFEEVVELQALFGRDTTIRFRYVHDFAYGFDWAKWVRRAPEERRDVGPFDLAFLRALRTRGHELLALIEADDTTYPQLRSPEARNPFVFDREPEAELALYRDLATRDLVPVRAWTFDEPPVWDRPFAEARVERARALGLARPD